MCQVSSSYSLLVRCHCLRVMHCISCHHAHFIFIHVRLMHPSIFPVVRFAFRRSVLLRWSFLPLFRVWGLNISGLYRDLPSGLGLLPVDRLSFCTIWKSFDAPTVNRGTEKASCVLQPNTLPKWPKTHLKPFQPLGRSITIAWPKTAPHLDSPSSSYAYLKIPRKSPSPSSRKP